MSKLKPLITAQDVIELALTNQNMDDSIVKDVFILIASEEHIRPVLGEDLYEELCTQHDANTLDADNEILVEDFLKHALAFYTKFEILTDMNMNTTSKGIQVNLSEFAQGPTNQQRSDLTTKAKSHADTLRDRMIKFIVNEQDDNDKYPLYKGAEDITNSASLSGGILIRKPHRIFRPDL